MAVPPANMSRQPFFPHGVRASRIERDMSDLTRSAVVTTIEFAVDVVGTTIVFLR